MQAQGISRSRVILMAVAAGICVANIYYNQPLLKAMAVSFQTDEKRIGLSAVLTQVGYGFGLFFLVPLGDKMNKKKLILFLQAALIILLTGIALSPTLLMLYICCALLGLLGVAAQVILPMAAGIDPANRGRNLGIVFTGILTGVLLARVFSGFIAQWLSWRYVYGISAVMVAGVAIITKRYFPDAPPAFTGSYGSLIQSTAYQLKRFSLLQRAALLGALVFGIFCAFWTTLTFHLSSEPFSYRPDTIGLFGLLAAGGALLAPVFGKLADKKSPALSQACSLLLIIGSVVAMKLFPYSAGSLAIAIVVLDIGVQATLVTNATSIYTLDAASHSRINTVYMTIYFMGGAAGTFTGLQCWQAGGWQMVTWQLIIWSTLALVVVIAGIIKQRKWSLSS